MYINFISSFILNYHHSGNSDPIVLTWAQLNCWCWQEHCLQITRTPFSCSLKIGLCSSNSQEPKFKLGVLFIETGLLFYHKPVGILIILTFTHFGSKLGIGGAAHRGLCPNKSVQQLISVNQWVRNNFWNRSISMTTWGTFAHINSVSANIVQQNPLVSQTRQQHQALTSNFKSQIPDMNSQGTAEGFTTGKTVTVERLMLTECIRLCLPDKQE